MTKRKPTQWEINNIICSLPKERAAEVLHKNGYVKSISEANKLIDKANGKGETSANS